MKAPYIARDTKQPLYALGHPIAADGSILRQDIIHKEPPLMNYGDFKLLCDLGYAGCVERKYYGVIDRVDRTRVAAVADWNANSDKFNQWHSCDALEHMKHMLNVAGVEIVSEDELPGSVDRDKWLPMSCVWCGVRVGPSA